MNKLFRCQKQLSLPFSLGTESAWLSRHCSLHNFHIPTHQLQHTLHLLTANSSVRHGNAV